MMLLNTLLYARTRTRTIPPLEQMYDEQTRFIFSNNTSQPFPSRAYCVDVGSPHIFLALYYLFSIRCNIGSKDPILGTISDRSFSFLINAFARYPSYLILLLACLCVPLTAIFQFPFPCTNAPLPASFQCPSSNPYFLISSFRYAMKIDRIFIKNNHHGPMFGFNLYI